MYAKYLRANNILSKFNFFPESIKKIINSGATKIFHDKYSFLDLIDNWSKSRSIFYSGAIAYPESMKKKFFKTHNFIEDPVVSQIYPGMSQGYDSYEYLNYHVKNKSISTEFVNIMLYLELKNRLPELLLMRADKMTMSASIEGREPFLDHKLVEFAFNVPENLKYKNGITKYILKKAAEKILPQDIIYRKKVGFAAPTKAWFKDGKYFRPYFEELLVSKRGSIKQYFDINFIEKMLTDHKSGKHNYADQLWTLQNLFSLDCF